MQHSYGCYSEPTVPVSSLSGCTETSTSMRTVPLSWPVGSEQAYIALWSSLVNKHEQIIPELPVIKTVSRTKGLSQLFQRQKAFPSNFNPQGCADGHCKPFLSSFHDSQARRKYFRICFQVVNDYRDYSSLRSKEMSQEVFLKESRKRSRAYSKQAITSLAP